MRCTFIGSLVGNIEWNTTEEELQELFSRVGEARFDLHREKGTSKSSGYGFVDYKDAQAALVALQKFNGYEVNGRELNVDFPSQSTKQTGLPGAPTTASKASPFAQAKVRDVQRQGTFGLYLKLINPFLAFNTPWSIIQSRILDFYMVGFDFPSNLSFQLP